MKLELKRGEIGNKTGPESGEQDWPRKRRLRDRPTGFLGRNVYATGVQRKEFVFLSVHPLWIRHRKSWKWEAGSSKQGVVFHTSFSFLPTSVAPPKRDGDINEPNTKTNASGYQARSTTSRSPRGRPTGSP